MGGEGFALEVDGDVGEVGGRGEVGGEEELSLPGLGGGVVDLEDLEMRVGVAVGEGVEAGTEEDVLGDSAGDSPGEEVFGVTAAGDEEGAKSDGERARLVRGIAAGGAFDFGGVRAEDGDGDGVSEYERVGVGIKSWWAARRMATRRAVREGAACSTGVSSGGGCA